MILRANTAILILITCGFTSCTKDDRALISSEFPRMLSLVASDAPAEFWGDDPRYPSTPYVLWLSIEAEKSCFLPIYRTGYTTSWAFISGLANQNGVNEVEIDACSDIPNRCYLGSTEWLGVTFEELGVQKAEACDPSLTLDPG